MTTEIASASQRPFLTSSAGPNGYCDDGDKRHTRPHVRHPSQQQQQDMSSFSDSLNFSQDGSDDSGSAARRIFSSPRYEAFVMTGEKILRIDPKISPNYAKLKESELPRHTEILGVRPRGFKGSLRSGDGAEFGSSAGIRTSAAEEAAAAVDLQKSILQSTNGVTMIEVSTSTVGTVADGAPTATTPSASMPASGVDGPEESSVVTVGDFCCEAEPSASGVVNGDHHSPMAIASSRGTVDELPSPVCSAFLSVPTSPAIKFVTLSDAATATTVAEQQTDNEALVTSVRRKLTTTDHASSLAGGDADQLRRGGRGGGVGLSGSGDSGSYARSFSTSALRASDSQSATRLAKRLYILDGFKRSDVSKQLAKTDDFSKMVNHEFMRQFNFVGLRIDAALRRFLSHLWLRGETEERERIIANFSRYYRETNPSLFASDDEVHTLACALLLLNTDLHGQNVAKKMSCHDFIENTSQTGIHFSRDLLKTLYQAILDSPIEFVEDVSDGDLSTSRKSSQTICLDDRFLEIPDPDSQVEYKKGWVLRKCIVDSDGRKMPLGRRSWRMFFATLKGMILYLHKDEHGFKRKSYHTFRNAIRIHHAFCERASDYTKKQHVFRLYTATFAEYLFQTSDPKDMQSWIDTINFTAACFSSPVLPAPVSSRQSFHRPLLPSTASKLTMDEQLKVHTARIAELEKCLDQLRDSAPVPTSKSRVLQDYAQKEIFLLYEIKRYRVYVALLRERMDECFSTSSSSSSTSANDTASGGEPPTDYQSCSAAADTLVRSGQSDRLSYREAIEKHMSSPCNELPF